MHTICGNQQEEAPRQVHSIVLLDRLALLVISLVLVHGLVAAPLLVNCIPADGRSLVELVGQDPCHHPFGMMEAGCSYDLTRDVLGPDDSVDPCVDLSLDSAGMSQNGVDLPVPPISASGPLYPASPGLAAYLLVPEGSAGFKLAREPLIVTECGPCTTSYLRI